MSQGKTRELSEILADEMQRRWDVMYRELRRRDKALKRAKAAAFAGYEDISAEHFKASE